MNGRANVEEQHTPEVKARAIQRLLAGETENTVSREMDIPPDTLRAWKQAALANAADTLSFLRERLVDNVIQLANSLDKAIDDAPLNQRAGALAQLVDRLIKLADKLGSGEKQSERVWKVKYEYPDGTLHDVPPWAGADSEE
jgi:hypothetical protein